jgi:large subunit ribosomal protein L9e
MSTQPGGAAQDAPSAEGEKTPAPLPFRKLLLLHGGLCLTILIWSFMHVIISVPLRQGAHPAVLSLYRECVGAAVLSGAAYALETRPPMDRRLLRLLALAGAMFAVIRLSIVSALRDAGPDLSAALTPLTPVFTLAMALLMRMETLHVRSLAGGAQLTGLLLCTVAACLMAPLRGRRLFGRVPTGEHAPSNVPAGVCWMLLNAFFSAAVQVVNKRSLATYPVISTAAGVAIFAVLFLTPAALLTSHAQDWVPTGWLVAAVVYSGFFATAANNVLLGRANAALGPTVANLWIPLQPVLTVVVDFLTLGDAVFLGQLLCGIAVVWGLVLAVWGKQAAQAQAQAHSDGEEGARLLGARVGCEEEMLERTQDETRHT